MATAASRTPIKTLAPAAARTPTKPLAPAAATTKTPTKPFAPMAAGKTPSKSPCSSRARVSHALENSNPNIPGAAAPPSKGGKSPEAAGAKSGSAKKKPATPAPAPAPAPPPMPAPRQRERRFLVAKKGARRRWNAGSGGEFDFDQCREAAREALRASQEEFFRTERAVSTAAEEQLRPEEKEKSAEEDVKGGAIEATEEASEAEMGVLKTKEMAKETSSPLDPGSNRVKDLVKAFENMVTISGATSDANRAVGDSWALPGLQPWKVDFPNAGANRLTSSTDGNSDRLSWDSRCSIGGRRSRRNSSESLRRSWNRKLKVTSQHPFKLRTEQRGRTKEQQFVQKVQEMLMEEERKRVHIAQGLPWTTDEPECLLKPPVREITEPIDVVLHSDVRAIERAEFDQYVIERNNFADQMRMERERQKQLEEEERIRQLRKELVPKAQPMPYFDRPFVPKRSTKPATIPVEPKFHPRPEKLSCSNAWSLES